MSDYPGEIVTVRIVDPHDEDDVPLTDLNATARISIYSADLASTYVNNQLMPWDAVVGKFSYGWDSTGRDPGEYLAKLTVLPTGGTPGIEYRVLELAAPPLSLIPTCGGPWIVPEALNGLDGLDDDAQALVVAAASGMLWAASGRQFSGVCSDTVRPEPTHVVFVPMTDGGWWRANVGPFGAYGPNVDGFPFGMTNCYGIELPGHPIIAVTEIKIDGVALPPGSWVIIDDRWVARTGGASWPVTQRLDRLDTEEGTWSVSYTWGRAVPPEGLLAVRVLALELAKAPAFLNDDSCRLPKRLTQVTREGFTAIVMDPFKFLDEGKFGIYEIDSFINDVNPHRLSRDGRVLNVDLLASAPRRVR